MKSHATEIANFYLFFHSATCFSHRNFKVMLRIIRAATFKTGLRFASGKVTETPKKKNRGLMYMGPGDVQIKDIPYPVLHLDSTSPLIILFLFDIFLILKLF